MFLFVIVAAAVWGSEFSGRILCAAAEICAQVALWSANDWTEIALNAPGAYASALAFTSCYCRVSRSARGDMERPFQVFPGHAKHLCIMWPCSIPEIVHNLLKPVTGTAFHRFLLLY